MSNLSGVMTDDGAPDGVWPAVFVWPLVIRNERLRSHLEAVMPVMPGNDDQRQPTSANDTQGWSAVIRSEWYLKLRKNGGMILLRRVMRVASHGPVTGCYLTSVIGLRLQENFVSFRVTWPQRSPRSGKFCLCWESKTPSNSPTQQKITTWDTGTDTNKCVWPKKYPPSLNLGETHKAL